MKWRVPPMRVFPPFLTAFPGIVLSFIFGRRKKDPLPPGRPVPTVPRIKMEPGVSYLLPAENPDGAFKIFVREVGNGAAGMIITRLHPEEVRGRFNIGTSSIHWLSRAFTKESVSPTNLGAVAEQIEIFVSKVPNAVILLDGIEYLIVQNDLQKVVRFVSSVRDSVAMHRAKMIIPFNMKSVDDTGRALLTRDLSIIRWNG